MQIRKLSEPLETMDKVFQAASEMLSHVMDSGYICTLKLCLLLLRLAPRLVLQVSVPWANTRAWLQQVSLLSISLIPHPLLDHFGTCTHTRVHAHTHTLITCHPMCTTSSFLCTPRGLFGLDNFTYLLPIFLSTHMDWALGPCLLFICVFIQQYLLSTYKSQQYSALEIQYIPTQ